MSREHYFKIVVNCGHVGARKAIEVTRYFKGEDAVSCYFDAFFMPRSKKKRDCVKLVEIITQEEYFRGKEVERANPYLQIIEKKYLPLTVKL